MNNTCHHQMPKIVSFKIQAVGKRPFLIFFTHSSTYDGLFMGLGMRVNSLILFLYDNRGMDISVRTLGFHHMGYEMIHQFIQFRVFGNGIHGSYPLHPLIHITIVEGRSPMFAFANTGCYFKVTETMRNIRIVPCIPHTLQGGVAIDMETVAPKAIRPMHST